MKTTGFMGLACLAGCLAANSALPAPQDQSDPAATVRLKFAAFDRHDAAAMQDIYGTDAVLHSPDYPDLAGNGPIADTYRRLFAAIPDAKDVVVSSDVIGDKVYAQFVLIGHFGGDATKPIHAPIISVYTVKAGHIIADTTYYDRKAP
jgi:ketosteroid isomerase-like protein